MLIKKSAFFTPVFIPYISFQKKLAIYIYSLKYKTKNNENKLEKTIIMVQR